MATIINDPYSKGRGGEAGEQIKNQIASGLTTIAQHKMAQITRHNQMQAYQNLGLPADISKSLSTLPPDQQKLILQNIGENQGFGGQQQSAAQNQQQAGLQMNQQGQMQQGGQPGQGQMGQQQPIPQFRNKDERKLYYEGLKEQEKASRPYYDKIVSEKSAADMSTKRLAKMEQLIKHGSLPVSGLYKIFKNMEESHGSSLHVGGNPLLSLLGPVTKMLGSTGLAIQRGVTSRDTEQFEKLSADFVKDAKQFFGTRLTDADLNAFLQMIPTLNQSDAGKEAIIKNMRIFNQAADVKYETMKEVLRENGGKRPPNFELIINERAKPYLDQLADQFLKVEGEEKQYVDLFGRPRRKSPLED
jgi:hypothetical protein